jgi:hypothetical protein
MILNFWKVRRAKAIEQMRDDIFAAVRNGRSICENVDYAYLSEDDRQANTEAVDIFKWIETDLKTAETHDEMLKAIALAKQLVDSQWFKHLRAGNEP